ncbi:MAG: response regulator transcription factor [Spirochaetales bacterium]|nr:response regulator transcription factor [Spirochaetales bacterium]
MAYIIIVEDNDAIREAAVSYLSLEDHRVAEFRGTTGVLDAVSANPPDLVILDVMLPDGNGFKLARDIRKSFDMPIVFLTAKTSETDRITGFEIGGDDYIVKPFSPRELVLRVTAILKRSGKKEGKIESGYWRLDKQVLALRPDSHKITVEEKDIDLTSSEWEILVYLIQQEGIVVSRERLLSQSLHYITGDSARTIDTHIKNIRIKLGNPAWIETVRGYGYRFAGEKQ